MSFLVPLYWSEPLSYHFLAGVPPGTIAAISDPVHGTAHFTLTTAATAFSAHHDILTPDDLTANEQTFLVPYVSSLPIRSYTTAQTKAHSIAATNLQPLSEHKKCDAFLSGLKPCNLFHIQIINYLSTHPLTAQRNFALLPLLSMPGLTPSAIPPLVAYSTLLRSHPVLPHPVLLPSLAPSSPTILSIPLVPLPVQRFVLHLLCLQVRP